MRFLPFLLVVLASCGPTVEDDFFPGLTDLVFADYFFDDFNRQDQALEDNTDWVVRENGGTFQVLNNQLAPFVNATPMMGFLREKVEREVLRISIKIHVTGDSLKNVADAQFLLMARSQVNHNNDDTYTCAMSPTKDLTILKVQGKTVSTLATTSTYFELNKGDEYKLTFTLVGSHLKCELTGSQTNTLEANDTTYTSGYMGVGGGSANSDDMRFDDFLLEFPI